jgi:hypothetical protein
VGNPAETKRRCNDEKPDTKEIDNYVKWNARIVGSKVASIV